MGCLAFDLMISIALIFPQQLLCPVCFFMHIGINLSINVQHFVMPASSVLFIYFYPFLLKTHAMIKKTRRRGALHNNRIHALKAPSVTWCINPLSLNLK